MLAIVAMFVVGAVIVALANMRQPWGILAAVAFIGVGYVVLHVVAHH